MPVSDSSGSLGKPPNVPDEVLNLTTDGSGEITIPLSGLDFRPAELYVQFLYVDLGQPLGLGFSNAVRLSVL